MAYVLIKTYLWQLSLKAHPPHPQEQEDLPFFFLIISETTIAMKITATIEAIMIVGAFIVYLIIISYYIY